MLKVKNSPNYYKVPFLSSKKGDREKDQISYVYMEFGLLCVILKGVRNAFYIKAIV